MDPSTWEIIGALVAIIASNFIFMRWSHSNMMTTLKDKIEEGDKRLHKRIDSVENIHDKCREEHQKQAGEMYAQIHASVQNSITTNSALAGEISKLGKDLTKEIGAVAKDIAVTKAHIDIGKIVSEKLDDQTAALIEVAKTKGDKT